MYLIYVDDSGDENRTSLTALAIPARHWGTCLGMWLGWRKKDLARSYGLPATFELHAAPWLGRRPAGDQVVPAGLVQLSDDGVALGDKQGAAVTVLSEHRFARRERARQFEKGLRIISGFPQAFVVTVHWEQTTDKHVLYGRLLEELSRLLVDRNGEGVVFLDGSAPGPHFLRQHRTLDIKKRRIIEDPVPMSSTGNQPMQMADWCAHAAFRSLRGNLADESRNAYWLLAAIAEPVVNVPRKT